MFSLAFAAVVAAQAGKQIPDGQVQVPTSTVPKVAPTLVTQITDGQIQKPVPTVGPISTAPAPKPTVVVPSKGLPAPSSNGTFTTGSPGATPSAFHGAANMLGWSKEIVIGAVGVAAGLAML